MRYNQSMANERALLNNEAIRRVQIARYLQYHMKELGVSHKELAKAAGMSPSRLKRFGTQVTPQAHVLLRLGQCIERIALAQRPTKTKTTRAKKRG